MTQAEQTRAFAEDLTKVILRYRCEFGLTVASMIGTIEVVKLDLWGEISGEAEDKIEPPEKELP